MKNRGIKPTKEMTNTSAKARKARQAERREIVAELLAKGLSANEILKQVNLKYDGKSIRIVTIRRDIKAVGGYPAGVSRCFPENWVSERHKHVAELLAKGLSANEILKQVNLKRPDNPITIRTIFYDIKKLKGQD